MKITEVRTAFVSMAVLTTALAVFEASAFAKSSMRGGIQATQDTFPLGKNSFGVWGPVPWKRSPDDKSMPQSFFDRNKDMDFVIWPFTFGAQQHLDSETARISQCLSAAEKLSPRRYMLMELNFWVSGNERTRSAPPLPDASVYEERLSSFIDKMNWQSPSFLGVCLSEENVPGTNGRAELFSTLYAYLKEKYPGMHVWQWFTPYGAFPEKYNVPADGWIIDPYGLETDFNATYHAFGSNPYRYYLDQFRETGKPVIDVVYASNNRPNLLSASANRFGLDIVRAFDQQVAENRALNVPTAVLWEKLDASANRQTYGFDEDDPDPAMHVFNAKIRDAVNRAHGSEQ